MNHEHRRFEFFHKQMWRPLSVHLRIGPGHSFELPLREPEFFGRAVHTSQVVDTRVRHECAELNTWIVIMTFDPIDHIPAVASAGCADSLAIDVGHRSDVGYAVQNVSVNLAPPVSRNLIDKLL